MQDEAIGHREFNEAAQQVAQLAQEFEALPDSDLRDKAAYLLQAVDTLHRGPLERLMELVLASRDQGLLRSIYGDTLVHELLRLYDLLPCENCEQDGTCFPQS